MTLLDFFGFREKYDANEDDLSGTFPNERTDLGVHVDVCARRFRSLRIGLTKAHSASAQNTRLLWAVILLLVASNVIDLKHLINLF